MKIDQSLMRVLEKVEEKRSLTKDECCQLLSWDEDSSECGVLKSAADYFSRLRFCNHALMLGQIGIESAPCAGRCKFCAFGDEYINFERRAMTLDEVVEKGRAFSKSDNLFALFLMTVHDYSFSHLLQVVSAVRRSLPTQVKIVINTGDLDATQADELLSAGVSGAYHIYRLREGIDTGLQPEQRLRTLENIRKAGLDLYYCCEPIGPEHAPHEIVDQMFIGIEFGCYQHGAMRRVPVPGARLAGKGQITDSRLAQIVAVAALATLGCKETEVIIVHEPNMTGLCAGANGIYAEAGANPRDVAAETGSYRGKDLKSCREMLYEAGFSGLRYGDKILPL